MRILTAVAIAIWTGLAGQAARADGLTVVELFTSQGCSSCPPADALLSDLAGRDDVIALALHVDYWDYLGWVDDLADPAYTRRQQGYARAAGSATVYTPQMVIQGQDHVVGARPMQVMERVLAHKANPDPVDIRLTREGGKLMIAARAGNAARADAAVQVVRYAPHTVRNIRGGENAGHAIDYVNTVTSWQVVRRWDMAAPLRLQVPLPGRDPVVVIVQDGTNGAILGAAELR